MDVDVKAMSAEEFVDYVKFTPDRIREAVPGQLFRDVSRFHKKFGLEATSCGNHALPLSVVRFRAKFLFEEFKEYLAAVGFRLKWDSEDGAQLVASDHAWSSFNAEDAFDALIDLVYVALGTAYLHRFPFDAGWARVQEANMRKVRAVGADDERSHRSHALDIVKPEGWEPPQLGDLL